MELKDHAAYQKALLTELAAGGTPDEVLARLSARPELAPFNAYLATIEPRMLGVAIELVARWGERTLTP